MSKIMKCVRYRNPVPVLVNIKTYKVHYLDNFENNNELLHMKKHSERNWVSKGNFVRLIFILVFEI